MTEPLTYKGMPIHWDALECEMPDGTWGFIYRCDGKIMYISNTMAAPVEVRWDGKGWKIISNRAASETERE